VLKDLAMKRKPMLTMKHLDVRWWEKCVLLF